MKVSTFVAFLMALTVSTAGFAGIDYLFTRPAAWHQHHSAELMLQASLHHGNVERGSA
jgi:hypothetical protein